MSEMSGHEDMHALVGAFALDALDEGERVAFERHLPTCEDCRRELPGLQAAAARLGATAYVTPPPHLRTSVLTGASRTRQLPPLLAHVTTHRPRQRFGASLLSLAAALLLVVAGGLGVATALERRHADQQADKVAALQGLLNNPERSSRIPVPGGGTAVISTVGRSALVEVRGAAEPPSGKTYELWVVPRNGAPRPSGLLASGDTKRFVEDVGEGASALALTLEPAGGSPAPTTEPFVTFTL